jgi:hypothetical protein
LWPWFHSCVVLLLFPNFELLGALSCWIWVKIAIKYGFFYMMHAPNQNICSIFLLQCTYHVVNRTCEHREVMWCMHIMSMYELHICKMFNYDGFGHWRSNESIVVGVQFLLMPNFSLWGGHWFFSSNLQLRCENCVNKV